jgi:hypothetical protein
MNSRNSQIKRFVIFSVLVFLITRCAVYEYIPNSQNVPLFQSKNELIGNFSYFDYQIGYAITNHLAVTGNYYNREQEYSSGWGDEYARRTSRSNKIQDFEYGLGYYKFRNPFHIEIFGGISFGKFSYLNYIREDHLDIYSYTVSSNTLKFFVQPNFGYKYEVDNKFLQVAFSTKIVECNYRNLKSEYIAPNVNYKIDNQSDWQIDKTKKYLFVQPALTLRLGTSYLNIQLQYGLNRCLNYKIQKIKNDYISVSIFFRIRDFFKFTDNVNNTRGSLN